MSDEHKMSEPAQLLLDYSHLFSPTTMKGAVLDLACGDGRNGLFLAEQGLSVVLMDRSSDALGQARRLAEEKALQVDIRQVDLEEKGVNPLNQDLFGGIIVFRYLHRPLIPCIRKALIDGGILIYETFTIEQARFGKPRNPDFLLKPGELKGWFKDWDLIYHSEGIEQDPDRAVARIVCRKPLKI
ncbi:MAG: methyltransferase domain-containing protein [Desulfatiglandales bacterium]